MKNIIINGCSVVTREGSPDFHRANGPAYINSNELWWGWYLYGKFHRYYGPRSNSGAWWIHDRKVK